MANGTLKMLIVDDDEGDRKQLRRVLKQAELECDCTETACAEEAIAASERTNFDCAIVDFGLPGRSGLEVITALRARMPHIAIILATGQGNPTVATDAMRRGAFDYIAKADITPGTLKRACANAMEKAALQMRAAEQREQLEVFANVLVHDLRAPLRSIQGFAGLIEQGIQAGNPASIIEDCGRIVAAAQRLDALIEALHRYTTTGVEVAMGPVEMNQVVHDARSNLGQMFQNRGVRLTHDALPTVIGSAPLLTQLMQNLLSNAVKYCEADVPLIRVTAGPAAEKRWRISVEDNGIGVPNGCYQMIFEPLKRLHSAGKYEGTGLGLATCKKIVRRHGGEIWCESTEGEGTTVSFTVPGA